MRKVIMDGPSTGNSLRYAMRIFLFLFILLNQISFSSLLFSILGKNSYEWLVLSCYFVQIISAPLQSSISDHYCRKTSLMIAWGAIVVSQSLFAKVLLEPLSNLLDPVILVVSVFLFAVFGNVTPIARAALVDLAMAENETEDSSLVRSPLALSSIALALGWAMSYLGLRHIGTSNLFFVSNILCVFCLLITQIIFKDRYDRKFLWRYLSPKGEWANIRKHFSKKWFRLAMLSYFFLLAPFYALFQQGEGLPGSFLAEYIVVVWAIGFSIGSTILIWVRFSDERMLLVGIIIVLIGIIASPVLPAKQESITTFSLVWNIVLTVGFGVFVPSLFSIASKNQHIHHQGVIFGIYESNDTVAQLVASGLLTLWIGHSWYWLYGLSSVLVVIGAIFVRQLLNEKVDIIN